MVTHEIILTIATILFAYSLIPQIYRIWRFKSATQFSYQATIITAIGLYAVGTVMFDLGFYTTALANGLTAFCWTLIFLAKVFYRCPDSISIKE